MDYRYRNNESYQNKSNTGFWLMALFTIILTGYMAYAHFVDFANHGVQSVVDQYTYMGGRPPVDYQSPRSSAIFHFICGIVYAILLLTAIFSALSKKMQVLSITFLSAIVFSVVVFFINEFGFSL